jgi:hypothetical protein
LDRRDPDVPVPRIRAHRTANVFDRHRAIAGRRFDFARSTRDPNAAVSTARDELGVRSSDANVAVPRVNAKPNPSRNANGHVERRRPEIPRPVAAPVGAQAIIGALVIGIENGADGDTLTRPTQLEPDVGHASATQNLLGPELDLSARAFGDGDVANRREKAEPLATGDRLVSREHLEVAAKNLSGGQGRNQGDKGQGEAKGSHGLAQVGLRQI